MTIIKDNARIIWQILIDSKTQNLCRSLIERSWIILQHLFQVLWLSLCALYVFVAWLVLHERNAKAEYWVWYRQKAPQGNLAAEFAKAAWALLTRMAISLRAYAENFLDQYQEQAGDPGPMLAAPTITPMTAAPMRAAP